MYQALHRCLFALVLAGVAFLGGIPVPAVAEDQDAIRPSLADLMMLTQLRHLKLWYAGRTENWRLASYELDQLQGTVDRTLKLYPSTSSVAQASGIRKNTEPVLADLRRAISDENNSRFEAAYIRITAACNQCHQAAGFGFIVVQVPTKSPFNNQLLGLPVR